MLHDFGSKILCSLLNPIGCSTIDIEDEEEDFQGHTVVQVEDADHDVVVKVSLDDGASWLDDEAYFQPESDTVVQVKLEVPDALKNADLEYMLELQAPGGTSFENGSCDGRRFLGKIGQQATLVIKKMDDEEVEEVEIIAAWATDTQTATLATSVFLDPEEQEL